MPTFRIAGSEPHHLTTSSEVMARKTRSGGTAIVTVARIKPSSTSATARADLVELITLPPVVLEIFETGLPEGTVTFDPRRNLLKPFGLNAVYPLAAWRLCQHRQSR